jgi:hypothetical protein
MYVPFMQTLFGSAPLAAHDWAVASAVALATLSVVTLEKAWRRRRGA